LLVVAEKGSVARSIRAAIEPPPTVLALSGHFLGLDFHERYRRWAGVDPKELFHAQVDWVVEDEKTYQKLVEAFKEEEDGLVIAVDNDHEGELIGYEVLRVAESILGKVSYKRMRFNSTAPYELERAWASLEPELNWGWVWKALFRHKFDLVTGAAYTRLLTLSAQRAWKDVKLVSWGSCQTPTLWFVFQRDMAIRDFKPETYYVIEAVLNIRGVLVKLSSGPIKDRDHVLSLYQKAKEAQFAVVEGFELKDEVQLKPLPTDTDIMLQELTKILTISGARIMGLAENLYAEGCISYPRTQTEMWVRTDHKAILNMLVRTSLASHVKLEEFSPRDGRKNDGAHPPIQPTKAYSLTDLKGKIWEYVARRYLANVVARDAEFKRWRLKVDLNGVSLEGTNRYLVEEGFYRVFPYFKPTKLQQIPPVNLGERLPVERVEPVERHTEPPARLTEADLLRLMEQHNIGTDATRQQYPALIVSRGYAERKGKAFLITPFGESLIKLLSSIDERLVTSETRVLVEEAMEEVEKGNRGLDETLESTLQIYEQLYFSLQRNLRF